jgi:hypothetical protein
MNMDNNSSRNNKQADGRSSSEARDESLNETTDEFGQKNTGQQKDREEDTDNA